MNLRNNAYHFSVALILYSGKIGFSNLIVQSIRDSWERRSQCGVSHTHTHISRRPHITTSPSHCHICLMCVCARALSPICTLYALQSCIGRLFLFTSVCSSPVVRWIFFFSYKRAFNHWPHQHQSILGPKSWSKKLFFCRFENKNVQSKTIAQCLCFSMSIVCVCVYLDITIKRVSNSLVFYWL